MTLEGKGPVSHCPHPKPANLPTLELDQSQSPLEGKAPCPIPERGCPPMTHTAHGDRHIERLGGMVLLVRVDIIPNLPREERLQGVSTASAP